MVLHHQTRFLGWVKLRLLGSTTRVSDSVGLGWMGHENLHFF